MGISTQQLGSFDEREKITLVSLYLFSLAACSTTVKRFQDNVNACLNLTVNATADPAATCACWNGTNLSADVPTIKSCNCKYSHSHS